MPGPLHDIVVLDLSRALAGPHAAQMLGDLGAYVIKVEHPSGGDESRGWGPPFVGPDGDISTYFLAANRNKRSITVDLKSAEGKELLERLVRQSDVLIENFRTGVLDRLGFPVARLHELNPRLVILSITGFGHDGPEGGRPGYDQIAQGEAGLMSLTGPSPDEPYRVGASIADLLAGIHGAFGVLAALFERERTGRGKVVRTSLLASVVGIHSYHGTAWTVGRTVPKANGNHHSSIAPYGAFRCADGMIQLAVANDGQWRKVAELLGIDPDQPKYATNRDRLIHRDELIADIEKALAAHDRAHWLARLGELGVPAGAIRSIDEVYAWDQVRSQRLLVKVDHPVLGEIELPGSPLRFEAPGGVEEEPVRHLAPPALGQDNEAVLAWLREREQGGGSG
ncbi:CoA transferase [Thermobispora bispora]|uniref:L-carnitine dehydratase/bile acid-inducible protein F n=1 Tax=Thermobispora bispora (strain ATCC 19993 / DSM 43833 / CBS 139.67 / JCM 10125 / KCTC 9307 / NBRC 14880 / R51) TaxID=469371 RepID=D6Y358_THEBD|nr:CoA transferase [Thermobispora bispora]MBO2474710.1 CoA transferase [Actinomycetales bacterium]MDI9580709.1 CoA transferase [Thermobispora sp.]ADG88933.1 L-carnitine dehydratase/bile acid-inducible protein F [Thermobispora bispora DSM 43833]MBX6167871.1 CoA transferase [Thermobispora bispora]QSI48676.1 CoA transferase [Thermobispora bispora]